MVVLHYTGMDTAGAAVARLCDPASGVSAHYVVTEDGVTLPLVDEHQRAWHAGSGAWGDVTDVNSRSIGIEIVNPGPDGPRPRFPDAQMAAVEALLAAILVRWQIPPERVIGHSDMAPGRKHDPGPCFNWHRLADRGLSVWPADGAHVSETGTDLWPRFIPAARRFGYRVPVDSRQGWQATLAAFRLRFRPGRAGPIAPHDVAIIENLAIRYPCAAVDGNRAFA